MNEWLSTRSAFGIIPEAAGTLFGTMFPAASSFGSIPKLDLRNTTKVDAAVGLRIELEFKPKFEV